MGNQPFLTVKDVAAACRVHVATVKRWIQAGILPAGRPIDSGSSPYLITQKDFDAFTKPRSAGKDTR